MAESYKDKINRILRDHEKYAGDGQGGKGALPIGDRSTTPKPISKRDLREAMIADWFMSVGRFGQFEMTGAGAIALGARECGN